MDINRNVGVRNVCNDDAPAPSQPFEKLFHYKSLPNIAFGDYGNTLLLNKAKQSDNAFYYRANSSEPNNNYIVNPCIIYPEKAAGTDAQGNDPGDEECAISGRLEIRVLSKEQMAAPKEPSPNPEESVYFDAVITNGTTEDEPKPEENKENVQFEEEFIWINKKEPQEKKYDIKVYEDSLQIQKYKIVTVDKSEDGLDEEEDGNEVEKEEEEKSKEKSADSGGVKMRVKPVKVEKEQTKLVECNPETKEENEAAAVDEEAQPESSHPEDVESVTDNRIENERLRDYSSSSNSKIPVFNHPNVSSRMLSQRSSWAGMEDPDMSDLTPGMYARCCKIPKKILIIRFKCPLSLNAILIDHFLKC